MDAVFRRRWQDLHHRQVCLAETELFRKRKEQEAHLDNAAALWRRHVATTQREVSEKAEGLKTVSYLGALLASLGLVAFLQFTYVYDDQQRWYSPAVQPLFAAAMASTVMFEMGSVVLCNLVLSSVLRSGTGYVSDEAEAEFMGRARLYVEGHRPGARPPAVLRSFDRHWRQRCERDWQLAFLMFAAGIPTFFATMIFSSWIKFANDGTAALIATVGMSAGMVCCGVLYWRWSRHLLDQEGEGRRYHVPVHIAAPFGLPFDWTLPPEAAARLPAAQPLPPHWQVSGPAEDQTLLRPMQMMPGSSWTSGRTAGHMRPRC